MPILNTKTLRVILYAKYEKENLHNFMETQFQRLIETQRNELLPLLQIFEELFDGTISNWKTYPVEFILN